MADSSDKQICVPESQESTNSADFGGFLEGIKKYMTALKNFSESNHSKKRQMDDVIFNAQQVMIGCLEQINEIRSSRRVLIDCLKCLQDELTFSSMEIDEFLEENRLTIYASLFKKEGLAFARELLNPKFDVGALEKNTKPIPFERFTRKLQEVEEVRNFLKSKLKDKLAEAGEKGDEASDKVTSKLKVSKEDLANVSGQIEEFIEDGKRKDKISKIVWGARRLLLSAFSEFCSKRASEEKDVKKGMAALATIGAKLEKYAIDEVMSEKTDFKSVGQVLDEVETKTTQLEKPVFHDFQSLLHDTREKQQTFEKSLDKFENDIKLVI